MPNIAILHETLPEYLRKTGSEEDRTKLSVVFASSNPSEFHRGAADAKPDAIVLDLGLLGDDPVASVKTLEDAIAPELTVIVYSFAKWDIIEALRKQGRSVMRAPVSMRALRSSMVSLIVKQMTLGGTRMETTAKTIPSARPAHRRYSPLQLAQLQEIRSSVDCECPNQVADLVLALNSFEDYSHQCKNKNAEDAKVHAMLAHATGHARAIMEDALARLCEYENIDPDTGEVRQTAS